jgi:acetolactate synthase-1/2/3 large subunit
VIALPEDMLVETACVADAPRFELIDSAPTQEQLATLETLLAQAKAPVAILGDARWNAQAVEHFAQFALRHALPTAVSFRRQMLFPADHPCYIGDVGSGINPALLKRIKNADLVLLVGGRLSENPSQSYTLLDIPVPRQNGACAPRYRGTGARLPPDPGYQYLAGLVRRRTEPHHAKGCARLGPRYRDHA